MYTSRATEAAARQHAVDERRQAAAATRAVHEREREARRRAALDRAQSVSHGEQQVDSLNTDLAEQIEELTMLLSAESRCRQGPRFRDVET